MDLARRGRSFNSVAAAAIFLHQGGSSLSSPGALGEWPSPQDASSSVMATVTTRGRMDCNRERFIGCLALKVIVCTCATPQARSDVTRPSEHQR